MTKRTITTEEAAPVFVAEPLYGSFVSGVALTFFTRVLMLGGIFFAGVRTTGIFCRPTCSAKKPHPQNVEFFSNASDALLGGYRPCLRCQPMDPAKRPPALIERLRAEVEKAPGGRITEKELREVLHLILSTPEYQVS